MTRSSMGKISLGGCEKAQDLAKGVFLGGGLKHEICHYFDFANNVFYLLAGI